MAQEEQSQKCSNSSSGGGGCGSRSSKKLKQKKIPQRGLGVAQLEKIRLEEQQKKDAAVAAAAILSSPPTISPNSSSFLSVPVPNYHRNQSSSLVPFPPPSAVDLSSPNSLFRTAPSVPNVDILNSNTVLLANQTNGGGFEIGWPSIPVPGHGNFPKLWNCESNLEGESQKLDPGLVFRTNFPYETNPIWPLPSMMQRTQQDQQPSSSTVKVSSATSSSSVLKFQMEPPSNQSYYGNYTPMWPEEEKMVGMKRPYPFSLDNPSGPSFHCKFPSSVAPISRSDESTSCGNGGTFNFEPGNSIYREGPSCSTSMSEPKFKKCTKENSHFNGDFLTLAPPTTPLPHLSSKFKHPSAYSAPHNYEFPVFETLPYQGSAEDPILRPVPCGSIQQQPFYSFLPPAKAQIGQATTTSIKNCHGEVGESVDLNLKL